MRHEPEDLPVESCGRATSLQQATGGRAPGREMLAASYLRELGWAIGELDAGRWDRVAREWERLAPGSFAQPVRVTPEQGAGRHYTGVTRGLDPVGALRVLRDDGEILSVRTAESVVPLEV